MSTIIDQGERISIVNELFDQVQKLLSTEFGEAGQEYLVLPQLLLFDQ